MTYAKPSPSRARSLWVLFPALLIAALLSASPASAFEQVGTFAGSAIPVKEEKFTEEVQLGGNGGMAVNYTGAGGVDPGTIYAVTLHSSAGADGNHRVARYNPDGSFSETWTVISKKSEEAREGNGEPPYVRCGPEGDPAYPNCPARSGNEGNNALDVAVDQTTGYVYVFRTEGAGPGDPTITVYSADGSEVITRFAERAPSSDTIPESPGKVHDAGGENIAVDDAGTVYVFDYTNPYENFYHRLMVFKPQSPGDYEHYVYTGRSNDIGAGKFGETLYPMRPVVDAAGNVYTATDKEIQKLDPSHPADPPVCEFKFKKGGIQTVTVNPAGGEVFFSSYQTRKVHRLSACKEGKFTELEALEVAPERALLNAMAFDPVRQFDPGRPAGVLYAGAPAGTSFAGGEPGQSSLGYIFAPGKEIPPEVLDTSVSMVTQSSARLEGEVNPKGTPTRYSFQYITDAAYQVNEAGDRFAGAGEAPLGGALIEGSKAVPVADAISGLTADTEYHFRLLAISHCAPDEPEKECVATGTEETFRTYPAGGLGLPDGRAYELVSPAEKNGGQVFPAEPSVKSCPSECKPGDSFGHFPMQSSPDGNSVVYEGNPFSFEVGAVIENEYIARRSASGWQSTNLTPSQLQSKGGGGFQAFKADLSEGVLEQQNFPLSSLGPAGYGNLYRQPSDDPLALTPLLVEAPPNRDPGNDPDGLKLFFAGASADFTRLFFSANDALTEDAQGGPEAKTNLYEWSAGQLALVNVAPGNAATIPGAVFGSGELLKAGNANIPDVVIAHAISDDGSRAFWSSGTGQVYVREDGEVTREFSDHTGKFLTASVDGSKVLLSDGCLYGVEADTCEDLTGGKGGFLGIAGQSDDLSRIYFVDSAVLSGEEENGQGDKSQAGKPNLYAWNEGSLTFIATLLIQDSDDWRPEPTRRSAEASQNGGWLAFVSLAPLTGFDNTGPCKYEDGFVDGPCSEVFLYEASTGELRCASCTPSAAAPRGPSVLRRFAGNVSATLPQPHYLTNSGRLFFDSQDSLSPADTNGRVEDVYEFEPNGVGSCKRAAGCVSLISAGRSGVDSNFLAADPSGRNVFFTSRDKLVPADKDELIDLYVAREGGGFPPPTGTGECQGEACLPAPLLPNRPPLGSAAQRGAGNLGSGKGSKPRCPKGKVRRRGKCTKKPKSKAQRQAKRNRGGAK